MNSYVMEMREIEENEGEGIERTGMKRRDNRQVIEENEIEKETEIKSQ